MAALARSCSRAAVATRWSSRTTPPARTSRDSSADETFDDTSGVALATIAARSTSSVERPAGSGCTRTRTSGCCAFHCAASRVASFTSAGFAAGQ